MVFPTLRYAIPFAFGAIVALLLTPLARRAAFRLGAIDHPGERRIHSVPTPRFGGMVIYCALALALAPVIYIDVFVDRLLLGQTETIVVIVGATMVLAIGIFDDCRSVSAWIKLGIESAAAALVVIVGGFSIHTIFGFNLGWLSVPISILWIITVVNGVNLIDGLDGLATGASLISSATLFAVSLYLKDVATALILSGLCGTLVGFLYYNFYPAKLFLGDSGSLLIGFVIAVIAIHSSTKSAAVVAILAPMLAVGLPLAEVMITTFRRTMRAFRSADARGEGASVSFGDFRKAGIFTADREHIHHRLLALGLEHRTTVIVLYGVCLSFGIVAFILCYQRIELILILAGAAAAGGAFIPRLDFRQIEHPSDTGPLPLQGLFERDRLPYIFLDVGLLILSWLGALLYNRSPAGPSVSGIYLAGPAVISAQMAFLVVAGMYRRAGLQYRSLSDLPRLLKPVAAAAVAGSIVIALFERGRFLPWRIVLIDSYLVATLICGSRFALKVLDYLANPDDGNHGRAEREQPDELADQGRRMSLSERHGSGRDKSPGML